MKKIRLDALIFVILITVFGIANLLNPDKPDISLQENRVLAKKPIFSIQSLFDKNYTKSWNNYYADTIFFREDMIQINVDIKKSFGLGNNQISIVVVGNDPTPTKTPKPSQTTEPTPSQSESAIPGTNPGSSEQPSSSPSPSTSPIEEEPTGSGAATGMYITVGDETFKLDSYSEEAYDNYAAYINKIKQMAGDDINVYSMLAPSRSTYLALTKYEFLSSRAANVGQINSKIDPAVKNVNVLRSIVEHVDEYIYYRTDHHWTHLGAYYGYTELMKSMGKESDIVPLSKYTEKLTVEGYLGFYNKPYLTQADYDNPDTIIAYYPIVDYTYTYYWQDNSYEKRLINKDRVAPDKDYYLLFSDGGFGTYSVISTETDSELSCMVIKDSFGDSLISFLLPHYKTIYVVDSRTYNKAYCDNLNIIDFAKSKKVDDIIVNYWITEITYIDDFMAKAYATLE
ncbi:MAG TPA: DHHW family protein [Clostridia bacterium]|nr:MAG: hypothetical protein BWX97_01686 [Firmicutes bacterium ADurb.Bin146]HOD93774.1 DHHW family protein [Clostridia bacterium]HQM39111.1 DHHW family protein [Clostridia bacterium]